MLFHKSLQAELRSATGGVLAVLTTTFVTMVLIRVLGRVASGRVDGELVLPLIVFNALSDMASVVMIAVYTALLLVLSRWWRDSEMVIWLSCGKSLTDFIVSVWKFLWPMVVVVAFFSMIVGPWARYQMTAFEDAVEKRGDAQRASPGQFRESLSNQSVFFIENPDDDNGKIGAVFIRSIESNGNQVIVGSKTGRIESDETGQRWIVLERGYRLDMVSESLMSRLMAFDVYRVRSDQSSAAYQANDAARTTPIWDLWSRTEPVAKGEMLIRVGIPLLTLSLGIIAIPLAVSSVRSGRAANLIIALLIYLIVSNVFGTMKVLLTQDRTSFALALWSVPLAVLLAAAAMLRWHMTQLPSVSDLIWALVRRLRPRPKATPT